MEKFYIISLAIFQSGGTLISGNYFKENLSVVQALFLSSEMAGRSKKNSHRYGPPVSLIRRRVLRGKIEKLAADSISCSFEEQRSCVVFLN